MDDDLKQAEEYLRAIKIPVRLSCKTQSGWPMIVSLWYYYQHGKIFCATQNTAKIVGYLQNEPRCAFEISADLPPYCGVRGQAIASIDEDIGGKILEKLLERYLGGMDNPLARTLLAKSDTEVALVLKPKQVYTWDFTSRMSSLPTINSFEKNCP